MKNQDAPMFRRKEALLVFEKLGNVTRTKTKEGFKKMADKRALSLSRSL